MKRSTELYKDMQALADEAKKFLDEHEAADGTMSASDAATYAKMEMAIKSAKLEAQAAELEEAKRMQDFLKNIDKQHVAYDGVKSGNVSFQRAGVAGDDYEKNFWAAVKGRFKVSNVNQLREASPSQGGYLVPTEFDQMIQSALEQENVMRQIGTVFTTASEHRIPVVATKPAASWVAEGQSIDLAQETFNAITLSAYKLAVAISASNELLADSFYNIEAHLTDEFTKAIARAEEEAFITGTGAETGMPTGILYTVAASTDNYSTTAGAGNITADDLINFQYSLSRPYRRNACWLINDASLAHIRKLKDSTQNFLWQPSLAAGEPPTLLGAPVYSSPFMPTMATGNIAVLYGDFSFYKIAERGQRSMRALRELYALQDLTAFLMIERVDGILTDSAAVRGLKVK